MLGLVKELSMQHQSVSTVQVELHPSPSEVFPSSQSSESALIPSPHWDIQVFLEESGKVPGEQTVQIDEVL